MKFGSVRGLAIKHLFHEFGELWCGGPAIPCGDMHQTFNYALFMVAPCNRADRYIFALWFLSIFFFPRLISAAVDWMSTILRHMVWP